MRYVVKCPYCGQNYVVEAQEGEDFQCDSCGAQNGMKDVVSTYNDTPIYVPKEIVKTVYVKEQKSTDEKRKDDPDIKTILGYDASYYPAPEEDKIFSSGEEPGWFIGTLIFCVLVTIFAAIFGV